MKAASARPFAPLRSLYYGWWTVLASALFIMYHGGTWWYGFGVLFKPLTLEFGWGRAATSLAFSLSSFEGGVLAPIVGWGVDRFGPRRLILLGMALFALGYVLLSRVASLESFLAVYVLVIGLGAQTCGINVHMANAARWFQRYRARAMGIIAVGAGLGGVVMTQMVAWFVVNYTWRGAALAIAAGILVVGIPTAFILRPHPPERYGLFPDGLASGEPPPPLGERTSALGSGASPTDDFTLRQALRTRAFWMLTLAWALGGGAYSAVAVHLVPLLQDRGVPLQLAATGIAFLTLMTIPSRAIVLWLADYMELRYAYGACFVLQTLGLLAILSAPTVGWIYAAVALFGFGSGATLPLRPAILGAYFGRQRFGAIQGWLVTFGTVGNLAGPLIMGWTFDVTGNYAAALLGFTVACALGLPVVLLARSPRKPLAIAPLPLGGSPA